MVNPNVQGMKDRAIAFVEAMKNKRIAKVVSDIFDESSKVAASSAKVRKSDCNSCRRKRSDAKSIRE